MMKHISIPLIALMMLTCAGAVFSAPAAEKVTFLSVSISSEDGKVIKLLGGSVWLLSQSTLALVTDDVIIVFREVELKEKTKTKVAVVFVDGEEIVAKHIGGTFAPSAGTLTTVVEAHGNGAVLELADGRLLSVPQYDKYDTSWWVPPYKALLTSNEMYLWNLKKGKRVWVNPGK